ncbi:4-hydroxy-tetrahydrodipicolinate synthase [Carboxydothermus hydrogenoformans]|uniref:4-hydroxy-tetrahydrodipicolinate synthase n=1 Tax=Carboxydothermus hydrogenoformans (strain ATCC BAA-161 / DSM 6008 / Z-2901) TaxID=246194 RepID=Q3ACY3_CARHZ|nr:4-hydroxy-tetrahydrodipicolinate synthase [Carboxydothermus hydrogenoformans]ABB15499.1 dihydrodipicolinate synthase [Carboxydothermus hydrogenoformans Z-2901]
MAVFGRLLTAMVTPFDRDGKVNLEQAQKLASFLVENGSDGIVVAGTTGESPTLSFEEKVDLFKAVVEAVGGKAAVIAGTGSNATEASIKLTKAAEKVGVDGVMLVAPYYNKPSQKGLVEHFQAIARATSLPVMIYNIPGRTGVNILPKTMAKIAELENVVAIKEAAGSVDQATELIRILPERVKVFSGDDSLTLPILAVGGYGVVSVASHLVGLKIKEMIDQFLLGNVAVAARLHQELYPLIKALFITTNPVPVKTALNLMGHKVGGFRLPLVDMTEEEKEELVRELKNLNLL